MKVLSSRVLELELRLNRKAGQNSQGDFDVGRRKSVEFLKGLLKSAFHNLCSNPLFYVISPYFISFIHSWGQWKKT